MPKWTDYTIKTEPADNDEVMVLDTAGKANKRLSLSTLSDWVLGKIADKVFEKLQTNDKTILGAINELNSKSFKKLSNKYNVSNGITENAGPHPIMSEKYTVIAAYNSYTSYIIIPFIASSDKTWRCYVMQTNLKPVDNLDDYEITFLVVPSE